MLGWPKRWSLAHALPWESSAKRLKLAQLLGQLGVFITLSSVVAAATSRSLSKSLRSLRVSPSAFAVGLDSVISPDSPNCSAISAY